jgi:hypothetical protein
MSEYYSPSRDLVRPQGTRNTFSPLTPRAIGIMLVAAGWLGAAIASLWRFFT